MGIFNRMARTRKRKTLHSENVSPGKSFPVQEDPESNFNWLSSCFDGSMELETLKIKLGDQELGLAYLNTLVDPVRLQDLLQSLEKDAFTGGKLPASLLHSQSAQDNFEVLEKLLQGALVIYFRGERNCRLLPLKNIIYREPLQPDAMKSQKGSKEGFVENHLVNLFLLRSRLRDRSLRIREYTVGTRSKSKIYLVYLEDLAPPELIKTLDERLKAVKTDLINDSVDLEQFLEESWLSPFPQFEYAERPDVVVSALCNGRAAILHDMSPGVLIAPTTFFDLIDVPDDYLNSWSVSSSIIRFIRLIAIVIATFLPSLFIALTAYNPDFIPTNLALLVAESREGVPLPTPLEAFVLVSIVEIGREAILRLTTIPAIITGVAGIAACILACTVFNLFSPAMVIVIFFSIVCASVISDKDLRIAMRELQFFYMLMASVLGIFGVGIAFLYLSAHAVTLKSFGVPYMSPLAPIVPRDWLRMLLKAPAFALPRPASYHSQDPDSGIETVDRKEGAPRE